jgi:cytochrome c-type biogenesis protein CcmF
MLKTWTVSLVLGTGVLAVLGTFLVRSGILQSIHAFGASTLGLPFLVFIGILAIGSVWLVAFRRDELRSARREYSLLSREAVFLLNNLVLVGLCFVIFWGTFFPLISQVLSGQKDAVGPEWFNRYTTPLAIVLVLLSGIGPAFAWRRTTPDRARRTLRVPMLANVAVAAVLLLYPGTRTSPPSVVMFGAIAFVFAAIGQEAWRAASLRRQLTGQGPIRALAGVVARNRRRYGGYLVHIGMAVLFVGIAASSAFQHISESQLTPGHAATVDGYRLRYVRPTASVSAQKVDLGAIVAVSKAGHRVSTLSPAMGYYPIINGGLGPVASYFDGNAESAVGLNVGVRRDIWASVDPNLDSFQSTISGIDSRFPRAGGQTQLVLLSLIAARYASKPPAATFRFIVSPLVEWIWFGGLIAGVGGLLALVPTAAARGRRRTARSVRTSRAGIAAAPVRDTVAT